jgi:hypothetical protein
MNVTDEMLMAYADGELDDDSSAAVAREIESNAELSAKLAKHRALRMRLGAAFDPVLKEDIPASLTAAINTPATTVADLVRPRSAKNAVRERQRFFPPWLPIAASITFGVLVGYLAFNITGEGRRSTQVVDADGRVVHEPLARALADGSAGVSNESTLQIGISYLAKSGEYCRSFSMANTRHFAGIACHEKGRQAEEWRVHMLLSIDAGSAAVYRQAGSALPSAVLSVVEQNIDGEPLDAEQEAKAIADGWKR